MYEHDLKIGKLYKIKLHHTFHFISIPFYTTKTRVFSGYDITQKDMLLYIGFEQWGKVSSTNFPKFLHKNTIGFINGISFWGNCNSFEEIK